MCPHYEDGCCRVAEQWARELNLTAKIPARDDACSFCVEAAKYSPGQKPCDHNFVTANLIYAQIGSAALPFVDRFFRRLSPEGVGATLHAILKWLRFTEQEECSCGDTAATMNEFGVAWVVTHALSIALDMSREYQRRFPQRKIPSHVLRTVALMLIGIATASYSVRIIVQQLRVLTTLSPNRSLR